MINAEPLGGNQGVRRIWNRQAQTTPPVPGPAAFFQAQKSLHALVTAGV